MKVIDFRLRPPFGGYLGLEMYADLNATLNRPRKVGLEPSASVQQRSMDLLLQEMEEAGIVMGVAGARVGTQGSMSNDESARLAREYPGKFVAFGAIDPSDRRSALKEVDRVIQELGFPGIVMDPGMQPWPMYLDDRRLYPIYQRCAELDVLVMLMAGGNAGPDVSYTFPQAIDHVTYDFPEVKFLAGHCGWPWTTQICGIALRRENLYFVLDSYMVNVPGVQDYVTAANYYMQDRAMFGSSYPYLPIKPTLDIFTSLPFKPEVLPKLLYDNAARLLRTG